MTNSAPKDLAVLQDHDELRATFAGAVKKAFSSQSTLIGRGEHCSLDPERLRSIGLPPGSQIRVRRDPEQLALYTVSETRQEPIDTTVRMALAARQRLGTPDEFNATIETRVPHPTFSDEEARRHSEFVERLNDARRQKRLVAIAPHGGLIERHTDEQAERVATVLGDDCVTVLAMQGVQDRRRRLRHVAHHLDRHSRGELPAAQDYCPPWLRACGRLSWLLRGRRARRRRGAARAQAGDCGGVGEGLEWFGHRRPNR